MPHPQDDDLRDAPLDTLVLESGRRIETLAKAVVTGERDAAGKPLMLGERMRLLRDRLDADAWRAYGGWSRARNAYVHAEEDAVPDPYVFYLQYAIVSAALRDLGGAGVKPPREKKRERAAAVELSPAEEAALAAAAGSEARRAGAVADSKPKPKPKSKRKRRKKAAAAPPPEPSVVGPVLLSVLLVGLALAYYSC